MQTENGPSERETTHCLPPAAYCLLELSIHSVSPGTASWWKTVCSMRKAVGRFTKMTSCCGSGKFLISSGRTNPTRSNRKPATSSASPTCGITSTGPRDFFQDHLKRYSKSRRKAPIYWPLSTPSGSYTIWLYYHRLNDQTLYMVVNKYVEPKIAEVQKAVDNMQYAVGARERGITDSLHTAYNQLPTSTLRKQLEDARTFLGELRDLREELLRIAALPYRPDLNDGVMINAAPLHKLFRLRSWAKATEDCWKKLVKGDYDWAHLAYTIWPERVREVCKRDRSIAVAHGLEDLCEVEAPESKKRGGRRKKKAASEGG